MNLPSSHETFLATQADVSDVGRPHRSALHRLPQYGACVGLGLLGGATGVALAIGLAILVQLRLPPPAVFAPGMIPLMVTATLAGLAVSWPIGRMTRHTRPDASRDPAQKGMQVILVTSVFASLAQVLLFFM